jgi:predicted O-methyltransferase YrrM
MSLQTLRNQFRGFWVAQQKKQLNLEKERQKSLHVLSELFKTDAHKLHADHLNSEFRQWYQTRSRQLRKQLGENRHGVSSTFDLETLYLLIRVNKPAVVIETGVLYGASSSFILEALQENGGGKLYSIDLPSPAAAPAKDFLVREPAKANWELIIGDVKEKLPPLLDQLKNISHFHHDSLHHIEHMLWEYESAFRYLTPQGMISSHDVITAPFDPNPFTSFCQKHRLKHQIFSNVGLAFSADHLRF